MFYLYNVEYYAYFLIVISTYRTNSVVYTKMMYALL